MWDIKIRYFNFSQCFNILYVKKVTELKNEYCFLNWCIFFNHFKVRFIYTSLQNKHLQLKLTISTRGRVSVVWHQKWMGLFFSSIPGDWFIMGIKYNREYIRFPFNLLIFFQKRQNYQKCFFPWSSYCKIFLLWISLRCYQIKEFLETKANDHRQKKLIFTLHLFYLLYGLFNFKSCNDIIQKYGRTNFLSLFLSLPYSFSQPTYFILTKSTYKQHLIMTFMNLWWRFKKYPCP